MPLSADFAESVVLMVPGAACRRMSLAEAVKHLITQLDPEIRRSAWIARDGRPEFGYPEAATVYARPEFPL